ncbi:MAG: multiheme c-type cytochrome [Sulfuricellaceae bacterium]
MRSFLLLLLPALLSLGVHGAGTPPPKTAIGTDQECVQCHPQQFQQWQTSAHAKKQPVAGCLACHGGLHSEAASRSRRDRTCNACHGGPEGAIVHSYASSKHGVLMRLEENTYDWTKPLAMANYRAPGCAYCHLHQGNHDAGAGVRADAMNREQPVPDGMRAVCRDCHAPRYTDRLLDNGNAGLEIGRKKVREAEMLVRQAAPGLDSGYQADVQRQLQTMRRHLQNVRLGAGHQSPDYQWWHGQPALDGDLLRIRGMIDEYRRKHP